MAGGGTSPPRPGARHVSIVLLGLLACGCAPRQSASVHDPAAARAAARTTALQRADALALQGCYAPVSEAVAAYDALLAERDDAAVRRRAFEAATLVALRERVLGLYPGTQQDAPARLAIGLPADQTAAALDVLELIEWRRGTRPPEVSGTRFADLRARASRAHDTLLPRAGTEPFAASLLVHVLSAYPFASLPPDVQLSGTRLLPLSLETAPWAAAHVDSPAFGFAWLFAQRGWNPEEWRAWFDAHPNCHEALVPIADGALALGRLMSADTALAQALDALPDLVPARVVRGEIRTKLGDYEDALPHFAQVVSRVPAHREARLGHLIALSNLMRHDEALTEADQMIGLGEWYLGEAYYWKAWNLFHQRRLAEARGALVEAKRLLFSADVLYLGGLIAYREEKWDDARTELTRTIETDATHCDAHFTLGAVHLLSQAWAPADTAFAEAADCFVGREPALAAAVAEVDTANLSEAQKTALRARRQQALDATTTQKHWARYNRAVALSNSGERDAARALAEDVAQQGGPPAAAASDLLLQLGLAPRETPPDD